jgi:hypothetical protein
MYSIVNHHNSNKIIIITFSALHNDFGMLITSITNLFGFCFANNHWLCIRIDSQILIFENCSLYCIGRICYKVFFFFFCSVFLFSIINVFRVLGLITYLDEITII